MAKPLPYREREILRRYAETVDGKQSGLAEILGVHRETVNRYINGRPCDNYDECMDLARRVLVAHPEWGSPDMDETIAFVKDRLRCDSRKARTIASVLTS